MNGTGGQAAPDADPVAIRRCLSPHLVAEFDHEWELVLDLAKQTKDLDAVQDFLVKWRHLAYAEMREPGSYFRLLGLAEQIMCTGKNPTARSADEMQKLIRERLAR